MRLIGISYAKKALEAGSREQKRMEAYACELEAYHLVVFTRQKDGLPKKYVHKNLTVHGTHARTRVGMLVAAYRIGRRILKDNPATSFVVSSQDPFESSVIGRALSRAHNATHHVQLHGDFYGTDRFKRESVGNWLRSLYGMYVLKRARCIRVVSKRIKDSLVSRGAKSHHIVVLPITTSLERFLEVGNARRFENTHTPPSFLFVGRLAKEKRLDRLLSAFAEVVRSHPEVRLRIVGEGPEADGLKTQVKHLDLQQNVHFTPWTDAVEEVYAAADVFVLPSQHEGYALVLLEAMAARMPVITTDVGCAGEAVLDQVHGHVVPVDDDTALAAAIKTYIEQPALLRQYAENAYTTAREVAAAQNEYPAKWKASFQCNE